MTPFEEFDALDRIFNVIKTYHHQKRNYHSSINKYLVNDYLTKHLSTQDLELWLRLVAEDTLSEFFRSRQTNWNFDQLLSHFKRAAHGLSESWSQSHSLN